MFAGVGERTREGNDLYHELMDSGVFAKDADGNPTPEGSNFSLSPDERAAGSSRTRRSFGPSHAEYFRDEEGHDVLLFIDNIFRFTQAGSEVSALLGRIPSRRGLSAHAGDRDGSAPGADFLDQQGLDHLDSGHLRSRRRFDRSGSSNFVCPPRRHDLLSRAISEKGIYPAVDPSTLDPSRMLTAAVVGEEHYNVARACRRFCNGTGFCRISSPSWAWTSCRKRISDRCPGAQDPALPLPAVPRRRSLHRHARQFVQVEDTVRSFKAVFDGEYDHLPEAAFYMVGTSTRPSTRPKSWRARHKQLVDELRLEDCVNDVCPWSGKPVSADSLTLYRGKVVGFCNPGCRDKFVSATRALDAAIEGKK